MTQTTRGIRAILSVPLVYETFQHLVGSPKVRRKLVSTYVTDRPGLRVLTWGAVRVR